jgi:hypothetical protein
MVDAGLTRSPRVVVCHSCLFVQRYHQLHTFHLSIGFELGQDRTQVGGKVLVFEQANCHGFINAQLTHEIGTQSIT